jgi:iron complex outermembrane receptor protein
MLDLQYQFYRYELSGDDRFNVGFTRDYNFIAPRAGLNYRVNENITTFANLSTASRQPAFKDIYDPTDYWSNPFYKPENFTTIGGGYLFDGKALDPERLIDLELGGGYRGRLADNDLDLKLNLYYMQVSDEIIPYAGQVDDNGYPISGNADKTIHQGIEFSARMNTRVNVGFFGNFSVNDDHFVDYVEYGFDWVNWVPIEYDRSGNRIGGFPSMLASYGATYGFRNIDLGFYGRFAGEQYVDNSEDDSRKLDSFHVNDLMISYDFGSEFGLGKTAFTFRANNLFDIKYVTSGYIEEDDGLPRYMVGAEQNFFLSLELGI